MARWNIRQINHPFFFRIVVVFKTSGNAWQSSFPLNVLSTWPRHDERDEKREINLTVTSAETGDILLMQPS